MNRIARIAAMSISIFAATTFGIAQTVTGTITNAKGKPANKVRIDLVNAKESVKTNKEGKFTIDNALPDDTLRIFASSDKDAKFPISNATELEITLAKDICLINSGGQLYKLPYHKIPVKNPNLITRETIQEKHASNLYDLLAGAVPGISIGNGTLYIRGLRTSITGPSEPLFVIDGSRVRTSREANARVDVDNIYSIEVKKNATEYGLEGAFGAIIIKTVGYAAMENTTK